MFVHCYQNSYLVVFFNYKATIQVSNQFSKPYTCIMKKDIKIQVWTEGPTVIRTNNISLHCTCNKSVVNVVTIYSMSLSAVPWFLDNEVSTRTTWGFMIWGWYSVWRLCLACFEVLPIRNNELIKKKIIVLFCLLWGPYLSRAVVFLKGLSIQELNVNDWCIILHKLCNAFLVSACWFCPIKLMYKSY